MIDNKTMKGSTRYVVVREFNGLQSMEDAFSELVERQAGNNYERWRADHGDLPEYSPIGSDDKTLRTDMAGSDGVADRRMDIMKPVTTRVIQTA